MKKIIKIPHDSAVNLTLSGYIGEKCTECGHEFNSVQDIKDRELVCSKKDKNGLGFACKKCLTKQRKKSKSLLDDTEPFNSEPFN